MQIKVGKQYVLQQKLGSGSFGEIFLAINQKTGEEFAVKLEPFNTKQPQLFFESKLYNYLHSDANPDNKGIPRTYYYGVEGDYNVLVMDLLGKSMENLFETNARKFSVKTVVMFGIQALERVEFLHNKFFLHRDLKPDNFLIGKNDNKHMINLIDFGLSKKYISKDNKHIPYKENKNLTGTARYASINTHLGIEQSRRDDLESLGYIMLYFLRGQLPWMNQPGNTQKEKYDNITKVKISTSEETLCHGFPDQFVAYLKYCKKLKFDEKPDYNYLKKILYDIMVVRGYDVDFIFDWVKRDKSANSQNSTNMKTKNDERNFLPRLQKQTFNQQQQQNLVQDRQKQPFNNQFIVNQNEQLIKQMKNYNEIQNNLRKKSLKHK